MQQQQPVVLPANSMTVSSYLQSCWLAQHPDHSFRVFCAVVAMLQPLHAQNRACGCLRPSQLVLHNSGQVKSHPSFPSPAAESELYTSPEHSSTAASTLASDVFCLGMLFFELVIKAPGSVSPRSLADIRQQVLMASMGQSSPPKVAFLLALLQPEPSKRPTVAQILGGNLLSMLHSTIYPRPQAVAQPQLHPIRFPRLGSQPRQQQQQHRQPQVQPHLQTQQQPTATTKPAQAQAQPSIAQADAALLEDFLKVMGKRTAAITAKTQHQLSLLDQDIQEVNGKLLSIVHQSPSELLHQTSAPEFDAESPKLQLQHPASRKRQRSWEAESVSRLPSDALLTLTDSKQQKSERVEQNWRNAQGAFSDLEAIFFKRREAQRAPSTPSASDASDGDHMPPGLAGLSDHLADFSTDLTNYSCYSQLQVRHEQRHACVMLVHMSVWLRVLGKPALAAHACTCQYGFNPLAAIRSIMALPFQNPRCCG